MSREFFYDALNVGVIYIFPYIAFILGVVGAVKLHLYPGITSKQHYIIGGICCPIVVSLMLITVTAESKIEKIGTDSNNVDRIFIVSQDVYAHEKFPKNILFYGLLVIYGTISVDLFERLRKKALADSTI